MGIDFREGEEVEITIYEGSWYAATIISPLDQGKRYFVEYSTLVEEENPSKPLQEPVDKNRIRPRPPSEETNRAFQRYENVDAYANDGWWQGVIVKVLEGGRYSVYFSSRNKKNEYGRSDLREHMDWTDGSWVKSQNRETWIAVQNEVGRDKRSKTEGTSMGSSIDVKTLDDLLRHVPKGKRSKSRNEGNNTRGEEQNEEHVCSSIRYNNTRSDEQNEMALQLVEKAKNGNERVVPGSLPFVKRMSVWESFDLMQAFRLIPQQPHFHPLEKFNNELREGKAIGCMFAFAQLAERTNNAKLEEPQSNFEEKLLALSKLEKHGFNVHPLRSKLQKMLEIKERKGQSEDNRKAAEEEIIKGTYKNEELDMVIIESEKIISQQNERLQSAKTEKEKNASKLDELKRRVSELTESIQADEHEFKSIAGAAW